MLNNNKYYMKILIGTVTGLLIIASSLIMKFQNNKIEDLEDQLYLKQQNEQRATDYYESILNVKTVQEKFNTLKEYSILKSSTVEMNHTYEYTAEGFGGIKKRVMLGGHGTIEYDVVVNFSTAAVIASNNGRDITIQIESPYIDQSSIRLAPNSLVIENIDGNLFANKKDGAQAQKLYIDSFVQSGTNKVIEMYSQKSKQDYLDRVAKSEVHTLVRTLNLQGNVNIYVEIIK